MEISATAAAAAKKGSSQLLYYDLGDYCCCCRAFRGLRLLNAVVKQKIYKQTDGQTDSETHMGFIRK